MIDSPYPGLNPFREQDAGFFFGRDAERDLIVANLTASRLTLVYGPSGVGKSSVLEAGVIAEMRRTANPSALDRPSCAVAVFRAWQSSPLEGVLRAIHQQFPGKPPTAPLRDYLAQLTAETNTDLYVILDQFEEYFLYQAATDADSAFAAELAASVNSTRNRVNFLVSIREDALAKLDFFKGRIENLFDNYLRIEHLSRDSAQAAVQEPVKRFKRLHPAAAVPADIEDGLVTEILDRLAEGVVPWDVVGRGVLAGKSETARIEAPYLQLVLRRLWDQEVSAGSGVLRLSTLKKLGGCTEIVKKHLDQVLHGLSAQDRELAAGLFHHLVTPSGAKIAHTIPDLSAYITASVDAVDKVVKKLTTKDTCILRAVASSPGSNLTRYEIFHDALAPAVLDWRRRQQNERQREGQRIAVNAFQNAIASGLEENLSAQEISSFVKEQVQKLSSAGTAVLAPGTLSGLRLLWVDDHPKYNLYELGLFKQAGMKIVTAITTEEAKQHLKTTAFDVVISDIHRRENGTNRNSAGYVLLEWMRRNQQVMPVIFYTRTRKGIDKVRSKDALGVTASTTTLIELVLRAVRQDDQQKGGWGGRPNRNYRRLQATVNEVGPSRFRVDLFVREARDEPLQEGDIDPGPLTGEVQFHLHQSFANQVLTRRVRNGFATCQLSVYGAFTVGAVADQGRTQLELDLALDESFPAEFRAN